MRLIKAIAYLLWEVREFYKDFFGDIFAVVVEEWAKLKDEPWPWENNNGTD